MQMRWTHVASIVVVAVPYEKTSVGMVARYTGLKAVVVILPILMVPSFDLML